MRHAHLFLLIAGLGAAHTRAEPSKIFSCAMWATWQVVDVYDRASSAVTTKARAAGQGVVNAGKSFINFSHEVVDSEMNRVFVKKAETSVDTKFKGLLSKVDVNDLSLPWYSLRRPVRWLTAPRLGFRDLNGRYHPVPYDFTPLSGPIRHFSRQRVARLRAEGAIQPLARRYIDHELVPTALTSMVVGTISSLPFFYVFGSPVFDTYTKVADKVQGFFEDKKLDPVIEHDFRFEEIKEELAKGEITRDQAREKAKKIVKAGEETAAKLMMIAQYRMAHKVSDDAKPDYAMISEVLSQKKAPQHPSDATSIALTEMGFLVLENFSPTRALLGQDHRQPRPGFRVESNAVNLVDLNPKTVEMDLSPQSAEVVHDLVKKNMELHISYQVDQRIFHAQEKDIQAEMKQDPTVAMLIAQRSADPFVQELASLRSKLPLETLERALMQHTWWKYRLDTWGRVGLTPVDDDGAALELKDFEADIRGDLEQEMSLAPAQKTP